MTQNNGATATSPAPNSPAGRRRPPLTAMEPAAVSSYSPSQHNHHHSYSPANDDDDDDDAFTSQQSGLLLRHDVINILLKTQHNEARARSRMLERKSILVHYVSVFLRWLDQCVRAKQSRLVASESLRKAAEQLSKGAAADKAAAAEAVAAAEAKVKAALEGKESVKHRLLEKEKSKEATAATSAASSPQTTKASSSLEEIDPRVPPAVVDKYSAIPHAALHTIRRQWQRRVAKILERKNAVAHLQRTFNHWRGLRVAQRANKAAMLAMAGVEAAAALARKRRKQVQLNSIEMQRVRALRAVATRAFLQWRLFHSQRRALGAGAFTSESAKLVAAERLLGQAAGEREQYDQELARRSMRISELQQALVRLQDDNSKLLLAVASNGGMQQQQQQQHSSPASLEALVNSLSGTSSHINVSRQAAATTADVDELEPPKRPIFFRDPGLDSLNTDPRPSHIELVVTAQCKTLKGKLYELRREMGKMRSDVKQASTWIAAECTEWDIKLKRKMQQMLSLPLSSPSSSHGRDNNNNRSGSIINDGSAPPPSWAYEKSVLSRRAAAYDALLEDHRMLQESLQAAEEDIARLRSLAVLREMHSPGDGERGAGALSGNRIGLQSTRFQLLGPGAATTSGSRSASNLNNRSADISGVYSAADGTRHRIHFSPNSGSAHVPPETIGVSCVTL